MPAGIRRRSRFLLQAMTRLGVQVEVINRLEVGDLSQCIGSKRRLSVKGVKDDPFEQVAESHVLELRERLQHLQNAPLHPDSGLDAFDFQVSGCPRHISPLMGQCYLGTKITLYIARGKRDGGVTVRRRTMAYLWTTQFGLSMRVLRAISILV